MNQSLWMSADRRARVGIWGQLEEDKVIELGAWAVDLVATRKPLLRFETDLEVIEFHRELSDMITELGGFCEETRRKYPLVFHVEKLIENRIEDKRLNTRS